MSQLTSSPWTNRKKNRQIECVYEGMPCITWLYSWDQKAGCMSVSQGKLSLAAYWHRAECRFPRKLKFNSNLLKNYLLCSVLYGSFPGNTEPKCELGSPYVFANNLFLSSRAQGRAKTGNNFIGWTKFVLNTHIEKQKCDHIFFLVCFSCQYYGVRRKAVLFCCSC